jgi:cysteine desulfurase
MPIKEIGTIAKKNEVLFFTDATQAVGKIPVDTMEDNIDLLSLSAHKFYGPKGVGALYVRRRSPRVRLTAQIDGGGHERGFRSGTLNVPGIVGMGKAAELAASNLTSERMRLAALRDKLEAGLLEIEETGVNGSRELRLPNVSNLWFRYAESQAIMMALKKELAVSSGSACTSASIEPSYVLKAIGLSDELAHSSLRFSLGRFTTEEEIEFILNKVIETVAALREVSPVWEMYKQGMLS